MNPDNYQQAWQSQGAHSRLTINADLLAKEVQRNQQYFTALLFWRDLREIGIAIVLVPLWIYLGRKGSNPWTYYLTIPALVWIAGFMLWHHIAHRQKRPAAGDSLRVRVESSLAQVEHQIWLLRNVFWWAILPISVPVFAFFGHIAWIERGGGVFTAILTALLIGPTAIVFGLVYWLNQIGVRQELQPRRQELLELLASLKDELPAS